MAVSLPIPAASSGAGTEGVRCVKLLSQDELIPGWLSDR